MTHLIRSVWLFCGIAVSASVSADAMNADDYAIAKDRISAEHKTATDACDKMIDNSTDARAAQSNDKESLELAERAFQGSTNAKEICMATADGKRKVATAELEYQRSASDEDRAKVDAARANAALEIAELRCAERVADAQDTCVNDAQAKILSSE